MSAKSDNRIVRQIVASSKKSGAPLSPIGQALKAAAERDLQKS